LIIIPFTGMADKAGHSEACTVCLPAPQDASRQEAAEPGAQREAAVPNAAVPAPDVAAEVELGAQRAVAMEALGARLAAEPGARPMAAEPDAQLAAARVVAARPAFRPSSEPAVLQVPTMVQEAAKILCRRLGLAVLSA
jgi:hypothetical protein